MHFLFGVKITMDFLIVIIEDRLIQKYQNSLLTLFDIKIKVTDHSERGKFCNERSTI